MVESLPHFPEGTFFKNFILSIRQLLSPLLLTFTFFSSSLKLNVAYYHPYSASGLSIYFIEKWNP